MGEGRKRKAGKIQSKWPSTSFKSFNSLGKDGFYPTFRNGINLILKPVYSTFLASLAYGYIYAEWTWVKATFIATVERALRDSPNVFRPIGLSSFMLRAMQNIIDLHLRDVILAIKPLRGLHYA